MAQFWKTVSQDVSRNKGNLKLLVVLAFRVAHYASVKRKRWIVHAIWAVPILVVYRLVFEMIVGIELPAATTVGPGLILDHGYALVVNKTTIIGSNCRLRHCTTIGCKIDANGQQGRSPVLGNNVDVGANASIIGDINIGDNVVIGAGSVVVANVPSNTVVAGNPARFIRSITS